MPSAFFGRTAVGASSPPLWTGLRPVLDGFYGVAILDLNTIDSALLLLATALLVLASALLHCNV